jgi:signal transduction histidine kinase
MPATSSKTIQILAINDRAGDELRHIEDLLTASTRGSYQFDSAESRAAALETLPRGEHDVAVIIGSAADESTLELLREASAQAPGTPLIALVADLHASDLAFDEIAAAAGAAEVLDLNTVTSYDLERAVTRATRLGSLQKELHATRRELDQLNREAAVTGERNRSVQLLHSILRNLPVIVGQLDAHAQVVDAQGAGLLPQGIRPERLIGRVFTDLFPQARGPVLEALSGGTTSFTLSGIARGREWHADFFVTSDRSQQGSATFLGRDVTERRWLEVNLLGTTDAEQQRLGTDIHDGLGQQLTGLAFMTAALRDRLKLSLPEEVPAADKLAALARDATQQSRALARNLHPVQLEKLGLLAALEELAAQMQVLHGITCRFRTRGPLPAREHSAELHVFRIAQEAIRNAVRHGGATHILVTLASHGQAHRLTIIDNGNGFDPAKVRSTTTGRGLRLMGYRANMIGGQFAVESRPGRGARIACFFTSPPSHENDSHHPSPA